MAAIEDFYDHISGNVTVVRNCFSTDDKIMKFIDMFFAETVYDDLCNSLASGDMQTAFRSAHTIKGLATAMGFTALLDSDMQLTDALRPNDAGEPSEPDKIQPLFERVQQDYAALVAAREQCF